MALVGHATAVSVSSDDSSYSTLSGVNSADFGPARDLLETTDFADTTGARKRLAGLKDVDATISGHLVVETAQDLVRSSWSSGATIYFKFLWDGSAGLKAGFLVENYKVSSSFDGTVQFTATLKGNGAITAV